jgi:two-component system, chemotaxis family, chemotaxis protein CheY
MRTHVERLPEYYPLKDEDLSVVNWFIKSFPTATFFQKEDQGGVKEMSAKQVLVVDDEIKIRKNYGQIFSSMGFDVATASNAVVAQDLLVHNQFDIVLLDINMAEVDGSILFEVMRAFHKNLKIIISSVYPIDEQKDRIRDADGYFDKSDDKDVLVSLVSSLS